jgi:hypothetical protein
MEGAARREYADAAEVMNPEVIGGFPKGKTRKQLKAKKDRAESKVKKAVRDACVDRDSLCRFGEWEWNPLDWHADDLTDNDEGCNGPSEWAHMHARRRSQTRNQAPEIRHDTRYSFQLCRFHHGEYDSHRLLITALTRRGADGPLKFRRAK